MVNDKFDWGGNKLVNEIPRKSSIKLWNNLYIYLCIHSRKKLYRYI